MWIRFQSARMVQATHEAELFSEGAERVGGLAEDELAIVLGGGKPAPLIDPMLGFRKGHTIGGIECTKAPGNLSSHFGTHGVQNRQCQSDSSNTFEESTAVDLTGGSHWSLHGSCFSKFYYFSRNNSLLTTNRIMSFIR